MDQERKLCVPTNLFSFAPYGTRWLADLESGNQLWIQTSENPKHPKWVRLGEFLESFCLNNPDEFQETLRFILDFNTKK